MENHPNDSQRHEINNVMCAITLGTDLLADAIYDRSPNRWKLIITRLNELRANVERLRDICTVKADC